jgi:hypothetical protein
VPSRGTSSAILVFRSPWSTPENGYRWISISGRATLLDDGAEAQIDRLASKYLGKETYPFRADDERRVTVRVAPSRIEARGLD